MSCSWRRVRGQATLTPARGWPASSCCCAHVEGRRHRRRWGSESQPCTGGSRGTRRRGWWRRGPVRGVLNRRWANPIASSCARAVRRWRPRRRGRGSASRPRAGWRRGPGAPARAPAASSWGGEECRWRPSSHGRRPNPPRIPFPAANFTAGGSCSLGSIAGRERELEAVGLERVLVFEARTCTDLRPLGSWDHATCLSIPSSPSPHCHGGFFFLPSNKQQSEQTTLY